MDICPVVRVSLFLFGGENMFTSDTYVRYGAKGIFQVQEIIEKKGRHNTREFWYVLHSLKNGIETSVTTPVINTCIRQILDKETIQELIDEIPTLETIWSENKSLRYESFQKVIESGSARKLAQLAKTLYLIRDEKELCGKQIAERDREYLKRAEDLLFEEISMVFDIQQSEVKDLILHHTNIS